MSHVSGIVKHIHKSVNKKIPDQKRDTQLARDLVTGERITSMTKKNISREILEANSNAVFIANLENGSQEWLDIRAKGIGGSEVGTICGFSKWTSPYTLWAQKTGQIESGIKASEPMEWGNRLEPVILDKFEDEHPELKLIRDVGSWHHAKRDWQIANPDAIYQTKDGKLGLIEVKTASYEDDWRDGVPKYYDTQVQWYLQTFGFDHAYVIVLFHGNKYQEYDLPASEFKQQAALDKVEQFREYVLSGTEPDYDGSKSTYETMRRIHSEIEDKEVELGDLGVHYFNSLSALEEAEAKATELKTRVMASMGKAKHGLVEGRKLVARQARGEGTPYLVNKKG